MEGGDGVEGLGGVDDATAVCEGREETEGEAEAVEEGWRAAEDIVLGERHAVADETRVVQKVAGWLLAN